MYFRGLVVGKASTIGIEISPTSPLIFTWGQKVQNLALFKASLKFEQPAARYPNSETKVQCNVLCPGQVWWSWVHTPL